MGRLSTHVLDTMSGTPAGGVRIELYGLAGDSRHLVASATTNADGRTDRPLLAGDELRSGAYELLFHIGEYFRRKGVDLPAPPSFWSGSGRCCGSSARPPSGNWSPRRS